MTGECSSASIWCAKFKRLWTRSDELFALLRSDDEYYQQPINLRLPLIFYLGHLPCFDWSQFRHLPDVNEIIHDTYDKLFERGVDPDVETGIVEHNHSSYFSTNADAQQKYWRSFSVSSIIDYKEKVREKLLDVLINGHLNFNDIHTLNILNMTIEHEMLHQETLLYLFAQLPSESLRTDISKGIDLRQSAVILSLPENPWIAVPGGTVSLGKPNNDHIEGYSFGWDNEFPCESRYILNFEIQSHPIRNGDFLQFILNDGYTTSDWWDKKTFDWINASNVRYPATWTKVNGSYRVNFVLQRDIPIELVLDHPVIVSQVEAKAYCRWLSQRTGECIDLPTESEWVYALWDWSDSIHIGLQSKDINVDFNYLHTLPVHSENDSKIHWRGSAFEWTSSVFRPFTGYRGPLPTYPGYSIDFYDDHHFVSLGASFGTDTTLIRRTFRNWFQDTYRYVFATFRCVRRIRHTDTPLSETDHQTIVSSLSNIKTRSISSQYFYDAHGSALYTEITKLKEYYPYMQELKLIEQKASGIRTAILNHINDDARSSKLIHLIELGCGDGSKIEAWLSPWFRERKDALFQYHPVDISQGAIDSLIQFLSIHFDKKAIETHVKPVCASFSNICPLLKSDFPGTRVVMLMGSTIGNFSSYDSKDVKYGADAPVMKLIGSIRENLSRGDLFVCAFDMCKDVTIMTRAYHDSKGVTSAFNFNLLSRLNRELNFNFNIADYEHCAIFNPSHRQMESWLISTKHQTVSDQTGFCMELYPYDAIQTEVSTKYTHKDIEILMEKHSMHIVETFCAEDMNLPYVICVAQID